MDDRQKLRQELRQRRRALTGKQQQIAAQSLCRQLRNQLFFLRARHIAIYLPNDGEIDPRPLMQTALTMGKKCYLPVLYPDGRHILQFLPFDNDTRLQDNRFGIPEPCVRQQHQHKPKYLDLVLMPLVGFDARGGRMGMGGGFYDRTFAFRQNPACHKPRLIGLAHQCQQVPHLELADWDIPLDAIATDNQLIFPE
ncbi:MAG: 5-formyltetrahydrofolate cyclo-ligase [Candidatus Pelagadaptatus aseana]|uniref:5-formyltetrahydrofolate cyclo-ligase n=1 Tax=Candidatus Pelagadaptatus aseana TaxID=3120508 RepID=UPI0039B338A6